MTTFVDGATIVRAAWLNAVDKATYEDTPQALVDISIIQSRLDAIEAPTWANDVNFSSGIDWSKLTSLPNTLSGYGITDGGTLINVRTFTTADSGSSYAPTPGTNKVVVEVIAGGGAGGTHAAGSVSGYKITQGGKAGAYASAIFTSNVAGTVMTIGAGGVSDGVNNGGGANAAGKTSSFGTFISCAGGPSGRQGTASTLDDLYYEQFQPVGFGASGIYQVVEFGAGGWGSVGSPTMGFSGGVGAMSRYGRPGLGGFNGAGDSPGQNASGFGAGGGGGASVSGSSNAIVGGNGAPGAIIIWEYA